MENNPVKQNSFDYVYTAIATLIESKKTEVKSAVNTAMITHYWNIGNILVNQVLNNSKAEYGINIIKDTYNEKDLENAIQVGHISIKKTP